MRHARSGKKLGRDSAHRKALYSNLAGAVIEHGRIKTTVTKAKAVKPIAEQLITLGRRGDMHARRQAVAFLRSKDIVHKLFSEVGPAFAERPGGYLRITRIGPRPGDSAEMAYLELVDTPLVFKQRIPPEDSGTESVPASVTEGAVDESVEAEAPSEEAAADAEQPPADEEEPPEEPDATAGPPPEAEAAEQGEN